MNKERVYIAIDLKSFYASVECVERGLDALNTNLVVADESRTEKTICLAVSPSLKAYGIPGRARLFEVIQAVKEINKNRFVLNHYNEFDNESYDARELKDNTKKLSYIIAPPRMKKYMEYSTRVYKIYLRYVAPEDIHVYSIDEVFMDVTDYLHSLGMTPREMAMAMIKDVLSETGITATAGIGTNMYLAKVAMDIVAKRVDADENGVRIAQLDEISYRQQLWDHTPITDFWRVGRGYEKRLEKLGLKTMGDIARCSVAGENCCLNENDLYKTFGVNAELLIDHAWGWEPCTIKEVKAYKPSATSISSGQVLSRPYSYKEARVIVKEMVELLALDLVEKGLETDQLVLTVGYDNSSATSEYQGNIAIDYYGRAVPKHAHGTGNISHLTSSTKLIMQAVMGVFERTVDKTLLVRRVTISANHITPEGVSKIQGQQLNLFTDYNALENQERLLKREKNLQKAMINIQHRYGRNAILKGINFEQGATTIERNSMVGGHRG